MRRVAAGLLAAGTILLLAACGASKSPAATVSSSSSTAPPAAGSGAAAADLPAPCSLITAAKASSSLGYKVTSMDSSADNDPDQISCTFLKSGKPVVVMLIRRWTLDHFTKDAAQEPGSPKPLSGVGTSAYQGANDDGPIVLTWEHGISVAINGVKPVTAGQVQSLAQVAVGQLDTPK